jgi:hypothetical protein
MRGFTVNIADFYGCGVDWARFSQHRQTLGLGGLGNPSGDADLREVPAVYNIGTFREARRLGPGPVCEVICIERKAKVLPFRNVISTEMELHAEEARGGERWSAMPNGSYDPPPSAA